MAVFASFFQLLIICPIINNCTAKSGQISLSDSVEIYVTESEYDVQTIMVITEIYGKTVEEKDITDLLPGAGHTKRMVSVDLSGTYAATENSHISRFVIYDDTAGLTHKILLYYISNNETVFSIGDESIYDYSGKLLYGPTLLK